MKKTNLMLLAAVAMSGMFCSCQPKDNTLTKAEEEEGWELLFNGQDLSEWRNYNDTVLSNGWTAVNGCIQASGEGADESGYIVTKRKFADFELSWDWKLTHGGNSGMLYHVVESPVFAVPYVTGPEYQLIDNEGWEEVNAPEKLEEWQKLGVDYAMHLPDYSKMNVNPVGEWNNSYQFARFHTQSTRNGNTTCFSDGGLDDRFDFILMADEIKYSYKHLRYVPNSYKAIGNDGYHFNQSINQGYNYVVPAEVAQALFDCSDHLPVTMKIFTDVPGLGIDESEVTTLEASVAPNPASDVTMVNFFNPSAGLVQFELYSLQGQLVQRQSEHFGNGAQQFGLDLQDVSQGFYLLRIRHQKGWGQTIKLIVR